MAAPAGDFSDISPTSAAVLPDLSATTVSAYPTSPRQSDKPSQDRPEQPPRQVAFGQQQPLVPGVLHEPSTRLHQSLLQARGTRRKRITDGELHPQRAK